MVASCNLCNGCNPGVNSIVKEIKHSIVYETELNKTVDLGNGMVVDVAVTRSNDGVAVNADLIGSVFMHLIYHYTLGDAYAYWRFIRRIEKQMPEGTKLFASVNPDTNMTIYLFTDNVIMDHEMVVILELGG